MVAKFVAFLALVAVASASNYNSFAYSVADPYTGDFKNQIEARAGNNVQGQYSLLEADGTRRTVDYAAGAEGFNAVVRKDPALIAAAPLAARLSYAAAPLAAPLSYAAAPLTAPLSYAAAPLASPLSYAAAPISKFGAIGYAAPLAAPFPYSRYLY